MKHPMIKLSLDEIKPGMLLARSIVSESGELLLSAGNVVNERVLTKMREIELNAAWIAEEGTEIAIPEENVNEQLALQSQFVVKLGTPHSALNSGDLRIGTNPKSSIPIFACC